VNGTATGLSPVPQRYSYIYQLTDDYLDILPRTLTNTTRVMEGLWMLKHGGTYYLLGSPLVVYDDADDFYLTAPSPLGPWTYRGLFAPAGSRTFTSQVFKGFSVTGAKGTQHVFVGTRWCNPYPAHTPPPPAICGQTHGACVCHPPFRNATSLWLPLEFDADEAVATLQWRDSWSLDTAGAASVSRHKTVSQAATPGLKSDELYDLSACNATATTPDVEYSGPSLKHGYVGDGSATACAAWCCELDKCKTWTLRTDEFCHLNPGQKCCMGWPAGRSLVPRKGVGAVSGRVDGKPAPKPTSPWPQHPTWEPVWDMNMSTIMMPCNVSGWFDSTLAARYGIADFDWSNARSLWRAQHPMDDGTRLITQIQNVKAINPKTHTWVYRNLVKALSWYSDVGKKLSDPQYSGWFLKFRNYSEPTNRSVFNTDVYSVPPCTGGKCSGLYHSQDQTPEHSKPTVYTGGEECLTECDCGVPCGEYLWCVLVSGLPSVLVLGVCPSLLLRLHLLLRVLTSDWCWRRDHRNASLREWLVNEHVMGLSSGGTDGMANSNVTGFYFDDLCVFAIAAVATEACANTQSFALQLG
jgi:hypothetical protein